ncbi:DUF4158 domain-containing protein [Peribacillus simplex]|uniref:DUF4158 domain-containing protein n=1 Tax=Peribacillus simplex TaxID=1478 RepID=UPI00405755DE
MLRGRELLTSEQRLEFVRIPEEITIRELGRYFTLSEFDLEIIKKRRRDYGVPPTFRAKHTLSKIRHRKNTFSIR